MTDPLGKRLNPKVHVRGRRRKRKLRALGLGLVVGVVASLVFGLTIWWLNKPAATQQREYPPGTAPQGMSQQM